MMATKHTRNIITERIFELFQMDFEVRKGGGCYERYMKLENR